MRQRNARENGVGEAVLVPGEEQPGRALQPSGIAEVFQSVDLYSVPEADGPSPQRARQDIRPMPGGRRNLKLGWNFPGQSAQGDTELLSELLADAVDGLVDGLLVERLARIL